MNDRRSGLRIASGPNARVRADILKQRALADKARTAAGELAVSGAQAEPQPEWAGWTHTFRPDLPSLTHSKQSEQVTCAPMTTSEAMRMIARAPQIER